jgi:hypothetical protein
MFANAVLMPVARVFIPTVAANAISATTGVLDQIWPSSFSRIWIFQQTLLRDGIILPIFAPWVMRTTRSPCSR